MQNNFSYKLNAQQMSEVEERLHRAALSRAVLMTYAWIACHIMYGYLSLAPIQKFMPNISLWQNTWPRLLFIALPLYLFSFILKSEKINPRARLLWFSFVCNVAFLVACNVNVWPLILQGHSQLYLYFHAANIFYLSFNLLLISPPPVTLYTFTAVFYLLIVIPVVYLCREDRIVLNLIVNEYLASTALMIFASLFLHKLRKKLEMINVQVKSDLTPFLGSNLVSAIYAGDISSLDKKKSTGLILATDIRGYTKFKQNVDPELTTAFMREYHSLVAQITGIHGGFVHKSTGDGHLISFGFMNSSSDLSEIPELRELEQEAMQRQLTDYLENAVMAQEKIVQGFQVLVRKYDVVEGIRIGAAIAIGEIALHIIGDSKHKSEYDIEGDVIIRAARLESYTKLLEQKLNQESSILILSPECSRHLSNLNSFTLWQTKDHPVRDFPNIDRIYFKAFKQVRSKLSLAS